MFLCTFSKSEKYKLSSSELKPEVIETSLITSHYEYFPHFSHFYHNLLRHYQNLHNHQQFQDMVCCFLSGLALLVGLTVLGI